MRFLIDKSLEHFYMSTNMQTLKYIIFLNIKGKHNFKHLYYIHIVDIPTQKGEHS